MDSKLYRAMSAPLWLALPLTGVQYWTVWNQLPARMATHFGAAGQPNGWMSREVSITFAIVVLAFLLATFTWALSRVRKPDPLAWALLTMFYVVVGVFLSVNSSVLNYNLYRHPLNILPELLIVFVAAFALIGVAFSTKRGPRLPPPAAAARAEEAEAEEVHASALWALVFAAFTATELALIAVIPLPGLRMVMVLPALLLVGVTALASSGFHYRFTSHGVEISTLGFRLRSIPVEDIKAYAVAPWNPLGGYGIRGVGERRAYVWGTTGVRIMLSDGEVFLGHREPERIMNDLDLIRQGQKARENTQSKSF